MVEENKRGRWVADGVNSGSRCICGGGVSNQNSNQLIDTVPVSILRGLSSSRRHLLSANYLFINYFPSLINLIATPASCASVATMKGAPFSTKSALPRASFATALTSIVPDIRPQIVCEGWLLKKRRKKMQGELNPSHWSGQITSTRHYY